MKGQLQRITWAEIRNRICELNPTLTKLIDQAEPGDLPIYYLSYPFGSIIVDRGLFYLPNAEGHIVPITDKSIDPDIQQHLDYSEKGIPAGIVLKNAYEVYIESDNKPLPIVVSEPGYPFALWRKFDIDPPFHPIELFSIHAGARSLFMLPNIGDVMFHKNLRRDYNIHRPTPKRLEDQWEIFREIANYCHSDWRVELIAFSGAWFERIFHDEKWQPLYLYLLQNAWESSKYERNQVFYEYALSCAQAKRNLKPNPYMVDTIRHLLSITLGATPGFRAATDETLGPIKLIQQVYADCYRLKKYAPTMMHPAHFNYLDKDCRAVYYSLQYPTTLRFSTPSRKEASTLYDLRELKYILNVFLGELEQRHLGIEDAVVGRLPRDIEFTYFHTKADQHGEIAIATDMIDDDPSLSAYLCNNPPSTEFASNGGFLRGCIRIQHKS